MAFNIMSGMDEDTDMSVQQDEIHTIKLEPSTNGDEMIQQVETSEDTVTRYKLLILDLQSKLEESKERVFQANSIMDELDKEMAAVAPKLRLKLERRKILKQETKDLNESIKKLETKKNHIMEKLSVKTNIRDMEQQSFTTLENRLHETEDLLRDAEHEEYLAREFPDPVVQDVVRRMSKHKADSENVDDYLWSDLTDMSECNFEILDRVNCRIEEIEEELNQEIAEESDIKGEDMENDGTDDDREMETGASQDGNNPIGAAVQITGARIKSLAMRLRKDRDELGLIMQTLYEKRQNRSAELSHVSRSRADRY